VKELKEKILSDAIVVDADIIKVDSFLNHQVDPNLMQNIGKAFAAHFAGQGITKVATIESSGIAPALMTAAAMQVPMIILKKQPSSILYPDVYCTEINSYTKKIGYKLTLSKKVMSADDHVLIVDDFLANGEAAAGAMRLIHMADATVAGLGIVIEKSFQPGREKLEEQGLHICSLARIRQMSPDRIDFLDDEE
jgi:xanthine phosphoribosyltransferase